MELNFIRIEIYTDQNGNKGEGRVRTSDISAWTEIMLGTNSAVMILLKNGEKVFTSETIDKIDSKITRAESPTFK
jgi:hypothetical protein